MTEARFEFGKNGSPPAAVDGRLDAPAFHRNAEPIWDAIAEFLAGQTGSVLEIGSGTGQHIVTYAARAPHLVAGRRLRARGLLRGPGRQPPVPVAHHPRASDAGVTITRERGSNTESLKCSASWSLFGISAVRRPFSGDHTPCDASMRPENPLNRSTQSAPPG